LIKNINWSGTIVAITTEIKKRRKAVDLMTIEILFVSSLFLIGTTLLALVAVRCIEQARFVTAAEHRGIRARKKLLAPNID
jgi:hypothetical protein